MVLNNQNDDMVAGDDKEIDFAVTNELGAALNIAGADILWNLLDGNTIMLTKDTNDGVTITNGAGGLCRVTLDPSDTASLTPKVYRHGLVISIQAGAYQTVSKGEFRIDSKVRA